MLLLYIFFSTSYFRRKSLCFQRNTLLTLERNCSFLLFLLLSSFSSTALALPLSAKHNKQNRIRWCFVIVFLFPPFFLLSACTCTCTSGVCVVRPVICSIIPCVESEAMILTTLSMCLQQDHDNCGVQSSLHMSVCSQSRGADVRSRTDVLDPENEGVLSLLVDISYETRLLESLNHAA